MNNGRRKIRNKTGKKYQPLGMWQWPAGGRIEAELTDVEGSTTDKGKDVAGGGAAGGHRGGGVARRGGATRRCGERSEEVGGACTRETER
jgi:hypothetical protein